MSASKTSHRQHARSTLLCSERLVDLHDGVPSLPNETAFIIDEVAERQRTSHLIVPDTDSLEQYDANSTSATTDLQQAFSPCSDGLIGEGCLLANPTMSSSQQWPFKTAICETEPGWTTDLSANGNIAAATNDILLNKAVLEPSEVWNDLQKFFETVYFTFPVLSRSQLTSRFIEEPCWSEVPELRTLILSIRLILAASRYRRSHHSKGCLLDLIRQVESSRLCYDFADSPTLDEVVVSLFLFATYNVVEKHNHAFLRLDEASFLLDAIKPKDGVERQRKLQLEKVLFNTETATLAIYDHNNKPRRARRPLINLDEQWLPENSTENLTDSEWAAMHLLRRLTQINLAEDAKSLQRISIESDADRKILFGAAFQQHLHTRVQATDIVVTRQWRLSAKLLTELRNGSSMLPHDRAAIAESLGTRAMTWVCLLGEGELRVVGLGKLSALAHNLYGMTGGRCQYVLAGLVGAVIKEDYEKHFAPALADLVAPMLCAPPKLLSLSGFEDYSPSADYGDRYTSFEEGFAFETETLSASMPTMYFSEDGLSFAGQSVEPEEDRMPSHENVESFFDVT